MGTMYTVMVVLHVVTAVFLVGPMAVIPMTTLKALRAGNASAVLQGARSTFIFSLGSLLVFLLGFAVIGMAPKEWDLSVGTPWVLISIVLYAVAVALNLLAVVPALRSAGEHLQAPDPGAVRGNDYRRITIVSGVVSVLLVAVTVLMVTRP